VPQVFSLFVQPAFNISGYALQVDQGTSWYVNYSTIYVFLRNGALTF
jgi:hypothetical protein